MKFTLTITLGNDAMQTYGDIAGALVSAARSIRGHREEQPCDEQSEGDGGAILDGNGNRVGGWRVEVQS